jgi:acyl-CoA synthetase (AMP-forming)/AMP-acid ligase II
MDYLVHHMLRASAERTPDKEAIVSGDVRLSYSEVWRQVCGLASGLRELGMLRGDRIGIYTDPSAAQALSILGVCRAGGVFVPVNEVLFPDQVTHIANDCRMRGLITSQTKLERVREVLPETKLDFVVVIGDETPSDLGVEVASFAEMLEKKVPDDWHES